MGLFGFIRNVAGKGNFHINSPTEVQDFRAEFVEFSFNSTNRVNAVSAPVTAAGPNSTNNTNRFNTVSPSDIAVSPNFGIARKFSFVDPFKYPDDPDMPELEDIVYSDDEEDVGAETDLSNLKKNIHVSPIPTTRVHKDHPVNQIIGDLNSAPQTRSMTRMVREQRGLHQINIEDFHTYIVHKEAKRDILLVQVYVDDIIFGFTNKKLCTAFEKLMKDMFQMSSMGELTFFLGLQVKQKDDEIFISQDKYVAEILRKFSFTDVKSASTPIETEKPLLKDPDGEDVYVHIYRYLKGKPHLGLWYPQDSPFNPVAYSDSDYAGASLDRKSTTGGCQFIGCRLISWQCKKQTVVATSSTKAEYVAAMLKFYGFKISCRTMVLIEAQQISNESLLLGVNTPRCDEDSIELKELMVFMSDASEGFDQIVDFLNAHTIQYALVVNPTIYVSYIKQFWATAKVKKVNDVVQLHALIDGKKVVVSEAIIRRYLHLHDADGVECLPNKEIFEELARMDPTPTPHATPLQDQPSTPHALPPHEQPTKTSESSMSLLTTLMETCATLSQKVAELEQDTHSQALEIYRGCIQTGGKMESIDTDENITLVDVEKDKEVVTMDAEPQGRINQEDVNAAIKGVSAAEPTIFDDKEVKMIMAQTLIKLKAKKAKLLDEQIAQKLHDDEVQKAAARDKQENDDMERAQVLQK
uniref:Reverse transcriptase Ty1/copia-type domain-containing protein n=1 Tax=Tanacetum cinerariifolium TaxID=118510 RepID=A0A6L2MMG3_TANCI|nr:hypothetical protein [Tanacetum cinerariifolium]